MYDGPFTAKRENADDSDTTHGESCKFHTDMQQPQRDAGIFKDKTRSWENKPADDPLALVNNGVTYSIGCGWCSHPVWKEGKCYAKTDTDFANPGNSRIKVLNVDDDAWQWCAWDSAKNRWVDNKEWTGDLCSKLPNGNSDIWFNQMRTELKLGNDASLSAALARRGSGSGRSVSRKATRSVQRRGSSNSRRSGSKRKGKQVAKGKRKALSASLSRRRRSRTPPRR